MYFGIKWYGTLADFESTRNYLLSIREIETTENSSILKFDIKDLRKLKILSLHDEKIKAELKKLQQLINDPTKIQIYGDKMPSMESGTTGSSGISGTSGSSGISGKSMIDTKTNETLGGYTIQRKIEIKIEPSKPKEDENLKLINQIFDMDFPLLDIQNEEIIQLK